MYLYYAGLHIKRTFSNASFCIILFYLQYCLHNSFIENTFLLTHLNWGFQDVELCVATLHITPSTMQCILKASQEIRATSNR